MLNTKKGGIHMKKVKKRLEDWFKKESVSSEKETKNNNVIAKLNMVLFTIVCLIIVVNILTKTKCIPLTAGADNVYECGHVCKRKRL